MSIDPATHHEPRDPVLEDPEDEADGDGDLEGDGKEGGEVADGIRVAGVHAAEVDDLPRGVRGHGGVEPQRLAEDEGDERGPPAEDEPARAAKLLDVGDRREGRGHKEEGGHGVGGRGDGPAALVALDEVHQVVQREGDAELREAVHQLVGADGDEGAGPGVKERAEQQRPVEPGLRWPPAVPVALLHGGDARLEAPPDVGGAVVLLQMVEVVQRQDLALPRGDDGVNPPVLCLGEC